MTAPDDPPTINTAVHYGPVYRLKGPLGESLAACRPGPVPGNLTLNHSWVTCDQCKRTDAYRYWSQYAD